MNVNNSLDYDDTLGVSPCYLFADLFITHQGYLKVTLTTAEVEMFETSSGQNIFDYLKCTTSVGLLIHFGYITRDYMFSYDPKTMTFTVEDKSWILSQPPMCQFCLQKEKKHRPLTKSPSRKIVTKN